MLDNDLEYLDRHLADAGRVELRALYPTGEVVSGLYDDLPKFVAAIHAYRQSANLYYTAQAPALRPVKNAMGCGALGNADIASFIRIVFDLDCIRDKGRPATQDQLEAALCLANDIKRHLYRAGWPLPVVIGSGNGFHLIYRTVPIPNTAEYNATLRVLYDGLGVEFLHPIVSFDRTVKNAGRIMRAPGSYNLKVPGHERMAAVVEYPRHWKQVQPRTIENTARVFSPPAKQHRPATTGTAPVTGSGDYRTLDVCAWFDAHGHYLRHLSGNMHAVRCPWIGEHTTPPPLAGGDTVVFVNADAWPEFHCKHSHCVDRRIRDVMQTWGDADAFCTRQYERRAR